MKTKYFGQTTLFAALLFISLPNSSEAYEVTDRHITRVSDTTTMYTISFKFGFLNADLWMPLAASRTSSAAMNGNMTSSVILSTNPIEENKYYVEKGKNGNFTLLVLEEHKVGESINAVTINKLPITIQKEGKKKELWILEGDNLKDFTIPKK